MSDPWITSLWTLQEAFLRGDAVFLSGEGMRANGVEGRDPQSEKFVLGDLIMLVHEMRQFNLYISDPALRAWKIILAAMDRSGISAMSSHNFCAAYLTAMNRTTIRDEDRVYTIQQLFNFRLGNTAPNFAGTYWTRSQLEDQLAEQLIFQHPVLSQLHVFTAPAKFGTAWRLNQSSVFPLSLGLAFSFSPGRSKRRRKYHKWQGNVRPTCKLSTGQISGATWCYFNGYVFGFKTFVRRCYEAERSSSIAPVLALMLPNIRKSFSFKLFLDASRELSRCPNLILDKTRRDLNDTEYGIPGLGQLGVEPQKARQQKRLCQWLASSFEESDLIVLELTSFYEGKDGGIIWHAYVLILLYKEQSGLKYFHRLGWC